MEYTILILLLPVLSFLVLALAGMKMSHRAAGLVGSLSLGAVAVLSYAVAYGYFTLPRLADGTFGTLVPYNFVWLPFTAGLHIDMGILLDPISVMMLVVISTVSLMVHIYSFGYMKGEKGFQRYYAFLSLFTFSMLGLVVATNIFQMYVFWELVGVSSYLLIGFYYTKPEAISASKKAFIVTRFADLGFLIGILIYGYYMGTFTFAPAEENLMQGALMLPWALGLMFVGGAGKSAMFPLHIWLPDAMEGPTPVSALIHAATMVVAGVYQVARMFPLYIAYAPETLHIVAYVGAFTAFYAASVACVQSDIKRVLAFSTISQIGFMMVALGVCTGMPSHEGGLGYMASMFHLFTHAMFKALLFLGAGCIIHAVHSNEMSTMGGLRKYMPVTHVTFLIACLAIAGIPPFSGFFSKDEILTACFAFSPVMGYVMTFIAGMTAFYMFRLYYCIFWGHENKELHAAHVPHESPLTMTFPLMVLAAVTCLAGFIPFGHFGRRFVLRHPFGRWRGSHKLRGGCIGHRLGHFHVCPQRTAGGRCPGPSFPETAPCGLPPFLYGRSLAVRHQTDYFPLRVCTVGMVRPPCDRRFHELPGLGHPCFGRGSTAHAERADTGLRDLVPERHYPFDFGLVGRLTIL